MKKFEMMLVVAVLLSVVSFGFADTFNNGTGNEFTIDFVTISGSAGDGYGGQSAGSFTTSNINNDYRMGIYEITNDQFAKFASNNSLWTGADVPSNRVSWFEAAQFTNYLNTSTGNQAAYKFTADVMGVWEDGDAGYDASNPYRNSNAKYFMPTEDEWVKAAYWNGTSLQTYATKPGESLTQGDGTSGTGWNYYDGGYATDPRGPWNVGSGSEELNGTFDMMGNVWEWMESSYSGDYSPGSTRGIRGGSYSYVFGNPLSSSNRSSYNPSYEGNLIGFRVASNVPEPCSLVLLGLGGLTLRRRKR